MAVNKSSYLLLLLLSFKINLKLLITFVIWLGDRFLSPDETFAIFLDNSS